MLFDLRFHCEGIYDERKALRGAREQFAQRRSVEGFDIRRAQGQRLIDRLPANVELRTFGRTEVAIALVPLGIAEFQTISAREIPSRSSHWDAGLPEGRPGIATATRRLRISRAGSLSGYRQRIRVVKKGTAQMRTADRETDRATRQVKQVAAQREVFGYKRRIL